MLLMFLRSDGECNVQQLSVVFLWPLLQPWVERNIENCPGSMVSTRYTENNSQYSCVSCDERGFLSYGERPPAATMEQCRFYWEKNRTYRFVEVGLLMDVKTYGMVSMAVKLCQSVSGQDVLGHVTWASANISEMVDIIHIFSRYKIVTKLFWPRCHVKCYLGLTQDIGNRWPIAYIF